MIVYNVNPTDTFQFATLIGCFQEGEKPGKLQYGSAWWFLDQKQGITAQIDALSNTGLLSRFIGMVTDSRSFMSYPRHEYFRRVLCDILGQDVMRGRIARMTTLSWEGSSRTSATRMRSNICNCRPVVSAASIDRISRVVDRQCGKCADVEWLPIVAASKRKSGFRNPVQHVQTVEDFGS